MIQQVLVDRMLKNETKNASAGNRTRAARVAGEHSTTEPPMLMNTICLTCTNKDKMTRVMLCYNVNDT